ncbi:carbohydrate porin [Curvibacter gracilis]|uniref:carbohydrate porin n=1 Tax=Curvibacter gracilis TaxID=230310 RepID=UPI0004AFE1ED|nr:carbohydrate porin [Curvibacter gracilis]
MSKHSSSLHSARLWQLAPVALLACSVSAQAADPAPLSEATTQQIEAVVKKTLDDNGVQLFGYGRGGFYSASGNQQKGQYQLGGDLQHYRLGNEGDNYIEFGIGKKWDLGGGLKWGTYYMPKVYNGNTGTAQVYADITGLEFAPDLTLWAGQRYHRIQDIHILDNWLMQDGDNYGAGVDGIRIGSKARLNLAVYTQGSSDNSNASSNNARRANFQLRDLPVNPGGRLTLTGATINGRFGIGQNGNALGLLHNQADFLLPGMNNSLFVQTSTGHAGLDGKFYGLDNAGVAQAGAKQTRIAEVIDWQLGAFGGQALASYQTVEPDNAAKYKDTSIGGRMSYGVARNVKVLLDVGITSRAIDGQATQHLNKGTLAVAFSPDNKFWTRPEFRVYLSRFNWNTAAGAANAATFGAGGRSSATTVGAQVEYWW